VQRQHPLEAAGRDQHAGGVVEVLGPPVEERGAVAGNRARSTSRQGRSSSPTSMVAVNLDAWAVSIRPVSRCSPPTSAGLSSAMTATQPSSGRPAIAFSLTSSIAAAAVSAGARENSSRTST
jgi:hypothetical protein